MDAQIGIMEHQLEARAAVVLEQAVGLEVSCRAGRVWITQYGDSRDIVLDAGEAFELTLPNAVMMACTKGASLSVRRVAPAAPQRGDWLRRLAAWLDPRAGSAVTRQLHGRLPVLRPPLGAGRSALL